jgi:tRNA pseudouridine55 synthase
MGTRIGDAMTYGLLNLDKPPGITSRDVVDQVQRLVRPQKAGHAGTLDPLATGVLVVCVGPATRLIGYVQQMPKSYSGTFLLGRQSSTEDIEGEVTELADPPVPTIAQLSAAAWGLTGRIQQRPPAYSALRVAGRRAYDLARRGQPVDLPPRWVEIHRLEIASYVYPEMKLRVECGSGTYVRSLGRDLAAALGTAAVMSALQRTAIGGFRLQDAIEPAALTRENWPGHLLPPLRAAELLPQVCLTGPEVQAIRTGRAIAREALPTGAVQWAALDPAGCLVAILVPRGPGLLGPVLNLP